jgi:hypothetical protein
VTVSFSPFWLWGHWIRGLCLCFFFCWHRRCAAGSARSCWVAVAGFGSSSFCVSSSARFLFCFRSPLRAERGEQSSVQIFVVFLLVLSSKPDRLSRPPPVFVFRARVRGSRLVRQGFACPFGSPLRSVWVLCRQFCRACPPSFHGFPLVSRRPEFTFSARILVSRARSSIYSDTGLPARAHRIRFSRLVGFCGSRAERPARFLAQVLALWLVLFEFGFPVRAFVFLLRFVLRKKSALGCCVLEWRDSCHSVGGGAVISA